MFPGEEYGIIISENCKDFIRKCFTIDPKARLGSEDDSQEVLSHPWFSDINLLALANGQITPIYKPEVRNILEEADGRGLTKIGTVVKKNIN